ncbi:MAG: nitrate reductase molybdenum cofactor assembly chaperone [Deltaproteobacteria bacterium HGW-Deltaproteobacteria-21]|nr:MAG: nitrate reductase molybdenum cofactor assembly chaperone [Deltaproteobacteria bacterium HGW-Deltaproteobacteria-21]
MDLLPKLISLLLQYPDVGLVTGLSEMEAVVSELEPESARRVCVDFLDYLRRTPLLHIQEEYTGTFDLNPSMNLNMSHHKWGDDRKRGDALAALSGLYQVAGFDMSTGELPDHLPLVLEFLSICPEAAGEVIKADYRNEVHGLARRLNEKESSYAGLLGLAAEFFDRKPEA